MGSFKNYATDKGTFIDTKNDDNPVKLSKEQYTMLVNKNHLKPADDKAEEIKKAAGSFDQRTDDQ